MDWPDLLVRQLEFHWAHQLRPRLDGLTDDEYLWEPVPGSWSLRDGAIDWAWPAPEPAPVTTIAWRLVHITIGCFGMRSASHFSGPPVSYDDLAFATTAATALDALDEAHERWTAGVRTLDEEAMARPCGEAGWEDYPMADLVAHINREVIHHGAEIALLRDLYLRR